MDNLKTKFYPRFYSWYTPRRDRIIRKYLRYLKSKTKGPMTMENKDRILKYEARYQRLAKAYWDARLANRPFLIPKEKYVKKETPESRKAFRNHSTQTHHDPNAYKGGYP